MMLISSLLFVIHLRSISAVICPSCYDISISTSKASLHVNQSYCELESESVSVCKSELFIDLIGEYPARVNYITVPSNSLIVSNGDSELVITISIPLDFEYPYASVIHDCYDTDLCNKKILEQEYNHLRVLNYTKLKNELIEVLYKKESSLERNQIECRNRNNKIEKCSNNGLCQATLIVGGGKLDSLVTTCVPDRRPGSRSGLVIESKSIGYGYKQTSISYICNKNQCNDPEIVHKVRQILAQADLVHSIAKRSKLLSIGLIIICIITNISIRV